MRIVAALASLAALAMVPAAARAQDTARPPAAADAAPAGAPVVVRGDTVLRVPGRFGSFTAEERAAAIAARLRDLSRATLDSLTLVPGETVTEILAGDRVLMVVSDGDAAALGVPRADLAQTFRDAMWEELDRLSVRGTIRALAYGLLWTVVATAVLLLLLRLLRGGIERLDGTLEARRASFPALRIKTLELLSAAQLARGVQATIRFLRTALVVVLLYFYLPLVLSFFPWTQRYSDRLLGYVLEPLVRVGRAVADYLPNVAFIAVILLVTRLALRGVRAVFLAIERGTLEFGGFEREWAEPTYKIVRFLIIAFVVVVLFPYLPGADSDAFKGVSIFLGVLFSLGSSSAVANVVAGVVLTYTRAFRVGDRVRIADTTGDVVAKTLLVTRLRTIKNVDVTIPNAMVLSAHVLNYTAMAREHGLILNTTVTIGYDVPWRQVYDLLVAAARATPAVLEKPAPFVLQTALGDFSVAYEINAYTDEPEAMARTYSLLHANIQDAFNAAGVEIMSPQYHALRDGNTTTTPEPDRPDGYVTPAFRVRQEPPAG